MKKTYLILCVLLITVAFLCLSSCNSTNNTESTNIENTKTEYTVVDTTIETTTFDSNNTTTTKTTVSDTTAESTLTETIVTETTATITTTTETTATETTVIETTAIETTATITAATETTATIATTTETTITDTTVTETTATIATTTETTVTDTTVTDTTVTETTATETTVTETTVTETTVTETTVTETTDTETTVTETTVTETTVTETTSTETTVTETTKSEPLVEHFYPKNQPSQFLIKSQKYKNRIYLFGSSNRKYYDRYNDTMMSYCSDPLCDHTQDTCVLRKFTMFKGAIYNSYNDRIYVPSGDNLFSFKSTGIDLRLDISFGDYGKTLGLTGYKGDGMFGYITFCDEYLFFTHCELIEKTNPETGETETYKYPTLYKYNTKTGKLTEYSNNKLSVSGLIVLDYNRLGFTLYESNGEEINYIVDFDFNVIDIIEDEDFTFARGDIITDEENMYTISKKGIIKFDKNTFEKSIILETDASILLLDIDQGYIYYSINDPFYVGSEVMHNGKVVETYNQYHTIYRISVKDRTIEIVYEGVTSQDRSIPSLRIDALIVLNDRVYLKGYFLSNYYDIKVVAESVGNVYPIVNGKIIVS